VTNPVTNYASLTSAISDYVHRADVATALTDGVVPTDYMIQAALEAVQNDCFDLNFGNGIRFMEAAYAPSLIQGGTLPVPSDWVAPKVFYVSDGSSDQFTLIFQSAAWINNNVYSVRQPTGLPAYIARDVIPNASLTASLSTQGALIVSALGAGSAPLNAGMILSDSSSGANLPLANPGSAVIITGQTTGTTGSTGDYTAASVGPLGPTYSITSEAMTAGGNCFIFGPYPDSNYQVSGTYYQQIPALSSSATTNWLTQYAPMLAHAACMVECAKFLSDDVLLARWSPLYQQRLKALVDRDKAERWGPATMQIETA
jgi:hypothetical protein